MLKENSIIGIRKKGSQTTADRSIPTLKTHRLASSEAEDELLVELVEALLKIDVNSPHAKLNETTISDNNGGRIDL